MLQSFQVVSLQVLILFILMAVGFIGKKLKIITADGIKCITNLMLYMITPCLLINAFQRPFDASMLKGFFIAALIALISHVLAIILAQLCIRDKDEARRRVLRFAVIFSNCGYMSLPLQQVLLGDESVFYGASFIAVFNLFLWTYGLALICAGKEKISLKKALLNPGTISVTIGLILFFCSIRLPEVIGKPIEYLSSLNTPVPMLIIGYYIACLDFRSVMRTPGEYIALFLRLVAIPLIMLGGMYLCSIRGTLLVACAISTSAPVATISTMFATRYDTGAELSASCVAVSTLCSIVTMTLIVSLAMYIA